MTIDKLIDALNTLKAQHGGDMEVTVWEYAGGDEELRSVTPGFNSEHGLIVLETSYHDPSIRR